MKDTVQKKEDLVNITHVLSSLLFTHDDLAMQVFVWLHVVRFRATQFGALYANLRPPHIFKHHISGKKPGLEFK
jgi:hypothetical protein